MASKALDNGICRAELTVRVGMVAVEVLGRGDCFVLADLRPAEDEGPSISGGPVPAGSCDHLLYSRDRREVVVGG